MEPRSLAETIVRLQDTYQVDKCGFPNTKLKFVHEIHNKGGMNIKTHASQFGKCVLNQCVRGVRGVCKKETDVDGQHRVVLQNLIDLGAVDDISFVKYLLLRQADLLSTGVVVRSLAIAALEPISLTAHKMHITFFCQASRARRSTQRANSCYQCPTKG
jgi:hypothetical protein